MRGPLIAFAATIAALLSAPTITARSTQASQLTFEDRVRTREAIERVFYANNRTTPFEGAVSQEFLERKVRSCLRQSVVLEECRHTSVAAGMLGHETERMARGTRPPQRLRVLFGARGSDSFSVQENLLRPAVPTRDERSGGRSIL